MSKFIALPFAVSVCFLLAGCFGDDPQTAMRKASPPNSNCQLFGGDMECTSDRFRLYYSEGAAGIQATFEAKEGAEFNRLSEGIVAFFGTFAPMEVAKECFATAVQNQFDCRFLNIYAPTKRSTNRLDLSCMVTTCSGSKSLTMNGAWVNRF